MTLTFGLPKTNAVRSNNMAAESGQIVSHDQWRIEWKEWHVSCTPSSNDASIKRLRTECF